MAEKKTGISRDLVIPSGETISDVLDDRGITQSELAARTGVSGVYVSSVIAGKSNFGENDSCGEFGKNIYRICSVDWKKPHIQSAEGNNAQTGDTAELYDGSGSASRAGKKATEIGMLLEKNQSLNDDQEREESYGPEEDNTIG